MDHVHEVSFTLTWKLSEESDTQQFTNGPQPPDRLLTPVNPPLDNFLSWGYTKNSSNIQPYYMN